MKKVIFILVIIAAAFAVYWFIFKGDDVPEGPKQQPLTVSVHSVAFNNSIDTLLQGYFALKDAFVDGDSLKARQAGMALVTYINRLSLEELKKDTTGIFESAAAFITDLKTSTEALGQSQVISDMRQDFKSVSENIYPLLKTIHYEGKKLYWQNCPTAFGPDRGANWISETEAVSNPYLGKNDPAYQQCGDIQDTIKAQ